MAHFAQINDENKVIQVIVIHNNDISLDNGEESEEKGIEFIKKELWHIEDVLTSKWVQTSYNANFRKNFAGIGFTYDEEKDAFISPQPYSSWTLDEETCRWVPPIPMPSDGKSYQWIETEQSWVEI